MIFQLDPETTISPFTIFMLLALLTTLAIAVLVIASAVIVGLVMGSAMIVFVGVDALALIGLGCLGCIHALASGPL